MDRGEIDAILKQARHNAEIAENLSVENMTAVALHSIALSLVALTNMMRNKQ